MEANKRNISVRFADEYDAKQFINKVLFGNDIFNFSVEQDEDEVIKIEFEQDMQMEASRYIANVRSDAKEYHIHGFDWTEVNN